MFQYRKARLNRLRITRGSTIDFCSLSICSLTLCTCNVRSMCINCAYNTRELHLANYLPAHRLLARTRCPHYPVNLLIIARTKYARY